MTHKHALPVMVLLFCMITTLSAQAGPEFPKSIKAGEVYTVPSSFVVNSELLQIEKLWLLTDNQYKTARILAEVELTGTDIERELSRAVEKRDSTILELKNILEDTKAQRQHYIDLWNTTHDNLEVCEIKKTKSFRTGFTIGAAASMVLVLTLRNIIP